LIPLLWQDLPEAEPYPVMPRSLRPPEVRVWLETRAGVRLNELRTARVESCVWRRNDVGEATITASLDDPGIGPLIVDGELTEWLHTDVAVAIYRQGARVWRGPVVDPRHTHGRVTLRCWSQEAYLSVQVVGGPERKNWFTPAGAGSAGYFDNDPDLSEWDIDPGVTATTTMVEANLWRRNRAALVESTTAGTGMTITGYLPVGSTRNYVDVIVRVKIPIDADVLTDGSGRIWVGSIVPSTAAIGSGAFGQLAAIPLFLEDGYVRGEWGTARERIPQYPNVQNRVDFTPYGGVGAPVAIGEVELARDENVSALEGQDVATLFAALFQHLIPLVGGPTVAARRVEECGVTLTDSVRHLHSDHDTARDILEGWTAAGDWWVELVDGRLVFCWGPRGAVVETIWLTSDSLAEFETGWDATEAVSELITAAPGNDGPTREEYSASDDAAPWRLPGRAEMPGGLSMRDLVGWADREIGSRGVIQSVEGVPVGRDGSWPGDILGQVRVADRVRLRIVDGPLDYSLTPAIEQMSWDPYTDRVTPSFTPEPA
jgi:hypothetical protein